MQAKFDSPDKSERHEELARENARLRGDLMTVARRLSHDLRTPLGGIIGSAEAMKEILTETDPASVPLAVSTLDSAEELAHLIKRASFVLKATAEPEQPQLIPMGEPVTAALQRLEWRLLEKKVMLTQPDSWPHVRGVSSWLEIIWWNLLVNAWQHANANPLRIELGWSQEGAQFKFCVSDNGPGVREERQRKLFQLFDRLHEPEAAPGLGLSIVHRLLELQGGSCGYQAGPQGGACFFFILP